MKAALQKQALLPQAEKPLRRKDLVLPAVRNLCAGDYVSFRQIRLESLMQYGLLFAGFHKLESQKSDDYWRQLCTETDKSCFFGLYDGDRLVGLLGTKEWDGDSTGKTALWYSSYMKSEYRGKGLAQPLYQTRENWTKARYEKTVFFILPDNKRSIAIHERRGAIYASTRSMQWPNCPSALWYWYEKQLSAGKLDAAIQNLESTYDDINAM